MAQVTLEQLTADIWVVSLFGEHDISMVDALRDRLSEAFTNDARLIIDLAETTFVDSTVLGVLFAVIKQATSSAGETLALVVTPGSAVDQTITLTGFAPPIVATYPSRDQVLAAWQDGHRERPHPHR
ncbi:MAG TPA: STAS domain-containing protein [Gaiellales bacterium]|jgi:anti-anti-sigma factor|nr:STAS domain-containing protein [Gaiellales bacterium]